MMKERLLIIGAGMACAYLLQELQSVSHNFDITVIGDEDHACYNRVLLSGVLAGETPLDALPMLNSTVLKNIRLLGGQRVEKIDCEEQVVHTHMGAQLAYDKLILATGSLVALPPIADLHLDGIEVFRSLNDTLHLQALAGAGKKAVVVGGGLLGLEAAHGLNEQGFSTTVIHRNRCLMNRQLDDAGADALQSELARKGLGFQLGCEVSELHHTNRSLNAISLSNGERIDCNLLLFATGVKPNAALARSSEIDCELGVLVDVRLQSSRPNVFALGECSQLQSHCFGLIAPIRSQAAVLARHLVDKDTAPFCIEDWPVQLKISGIEIFRAGQLDDNAENIVLHVPSAGIYRRLVLKDDRLIGAVLVGDKRYGTWYSELIQQQSNISKQRASLMFGPQDTSENSVEGMAA